MMQYTHPNLMYATKRLHSYTDDPSAPYFQGVKQLICYIEVFPHHYIKYPSGIDIATTHDLHQYFYPIELHYQSISNSIVAFVSG